MKRVFYYRTVFFFIFFFGICAHALAHTDITPQEAYAMINSEKSGLTVIDVREEIEYCSASGHIPGAHNYPWISEILQKKFAELPKDERILVVCKSGHRSTLAADFLDSQGYASVYDMQGGMSSWQWDQVSCIDSDFDGANDDLDNCPHFFNPEQRDTNHDGRGDACGEDNASCAAVAIYGEGSEEIRALRDFRDAVLAQSPQGQQLIHLYYSISPVLAEYVRGNKGARAMLETVLDALLPLVKIIGS
ncbi:MAG: rhodanese-like domain-containing protein [Pseudomonadota bacterium]